jgi:redox-sensitive bicupin YhaK (pirin superfamily)
MLTLRKAEDRGHADLGWLDSHHTFSFADYHDPRHMGFGVLRVLNDDVIVGGAGFPKHGHRDMEIVSYVLDGAIAHEDSMGTGSVIRPGDVQRMSAGTGVLHSEFNASKNEPAHFLQIWFLPAAQGRKPSYEQKHFSADQKRDRLRLIASPDGAEGSVTVGQDVRMYASIVAAGSAVQHALAAGRKAWVHVARGQAEVNGQALSGGDAVALTDERAVAITSSSEAEILLFDLPA